MRHGCCLVAAGVGCVVLVVGAPALAAPALAAPALAIAGAGDPWLVYVANTASNSVSVIDTATHAVVATIPVGARPAAVSMSPDSTTVRITNAGGRVSVIDTFTNAVAATETGTYAGAQPVATTPDGTTSYLADTAEDLLKVVDTATGAVVATISGVGDGPSAVAMSPDGATVYVANAGSNTVAMVDTASNSVMAAVAVGRQPSALGITPDQAPFAALTAAPSPAGQPTTLDASDSTVRFGTIASYAWNFGDGTTATTTVPTTRHVFGSAGHYTVTVTLTSSGGTSTKQVFSGRTLVRNGGRQARTVHIVAVAAPVDGEGGGLPITGTTAGPVALLGLLATVAGALLVLLGQLVGRKDGRAVPVRRRLSRSSPARSPAGQAAGRAPRWTRAAG